MKQTKLSRKKLDNLIESIFYKHGYGIQIPIMSIPKIYNECRAAYEHNVDLETTMKHCINKYRIDKGV